MNVSSVGVCRFNGSLQVLRAAFGRLAEGKYGWAGG